jgi:hypothetical protein
MLLTDLCSSTTSNRPWSGTLFLWDETKAAANMHEYGISFEEAEETIHDQ